MTDADRAAREQLAADGEEIVAIVMKNVAAKAAREGRPPELADLEAGVEALVESAFNLARLACGGVGHQARFAAFLRAAADRVEASA